MLEDDAARLQRIGEPQLKQVRAGHVFQRWVVMVPGLEDILCAIWKCEVGHVYDTPRKINMEPTNHPFRKEHNFPNLHDYIPY